MAARSRADGVEEAAEEQLDPEVILAEELEDVDEALEEEDFGEDAEDALAEDDLDDDEADVDEDLSIAEAADEGDDTDDADEVLESAVVPPDAAFDDDDEEIAAAVTVEDDDDDEPEGLRDGEFVCRGCYLAMRETQLADPKAMLCRDCV